MHVLCVHRDSMRVLDRWQSLERLKRERSGASSRNVSLKQGEVSATHIYAHTQTHTHTHMQSLHSPRKPAPLRVRTDAPRPDMCAMHLCVLSVLCTRLSVSFCFKAYPASEMRVDACTCVCVCVRVCVPVCVRFLIAGSVFDLF